MSSPSQICRSSKSTDATASSVLSGDLAVSEHESDACTSSLTGTSSAITAGAVNEGEGATCASRDPLAAWDRCVFASRR